MGSEADTGGDLVLTGVRKLYGPVVVLDVDRLVLRRGEVVGLLADRVYGRELTQGLPFLGFPARFSLGPFRLAR